MFLSFSYFNILVLKLWRKCLPLAADPGFVSEKLEDQIFKENGIERNQLGILYNYNQVALLCTYNYFVRQGLIKAMHIDDDEEQVSVITTQVSEQSMPSNRNAINNGGGGSSF